MAPVRERWPPLPSQRLTESPSGDRNGRGYDVARTHCAKFSLISPVWYLIRREKRAAVLVGRHDVDAGWLAALRAVRRCTAAAGAATATPAGGLLLSCS